MSRRIERSIQYVDPYVAGSTDDVQHHGAGAVDDLFLQS